ncbi:MAG: DUF350 domain-containing protein [Ardenticatenaceae bacterium]|nr:DUF350 domain-containing protein [Ardenticatenaceae bacterium]HBY92712.1 hypothetical protein [Chloroflexota bacterium]
MNPWILLQGGLPPVPGVAAGPNWGSFLINVVFALLWTAVAAVAFGVAIPLAMALFHRLTPGVDEFAELRRGNVAIAVVQFGFILSITLVVVAVLLK